jgi:hypothetical protein
MIVVSSVWLSPVLAQQRNRQRNPPPLTPAAVENAIDSGIEFLGRISQDKSTGRWPGHPEYGTGQTALATLALLNCGVPPNDRGVQKALEVLRFQAPTKTYEAALQIMVLATAEPARDRASIQRNVEWLVAAQNASGGWSYSQAPAAPDESNSQFALLGLWEAQRAGVDVPIDAFRRSAEYWSKQQRGDGGWGYRFGGLSTGSMTCAGIASMLITEDALNVGDASVNGDQIQCCGGDAQEKRVDRGLDWLARRFSVRTNPPTGSTTYLYYYLYALERVGRLSGRRFIGTHDWYREAAARLLGLQQLAGSFGSGSMQESDAVTATSLALLFLSKGKRKVVIGQLEYGQTGDWQNHRHAVGHLTGHIEDYWKQDLTWQTIQFEKASLEDLLSFPILFISGRERLNFSPDQKKLLTDYVEQGGFIFAEACNGDGCDGRGFDESFQQLINEMFGQPLRKLPLSHPVWYAEEKIDPNALPENFWLYGVEACCRTSVVYSPVSLSCRWEILKSYGPRPKLSPKVESDIQNAIKVGLNVAAYATGRELKDKLEPIEMLVDGDESQLVGRGQLQLPALNHAGDPDATPKATSNLIRLFEKDFPSEVVADRILIDATEEMLQEYSIVFLHGRQAFAFSEDQRTALRQYFENGGFILGDAICASPEFAESVRNEFAAILPDATLQQVPVNHPMLTPQFEGYDVRSVTINDPSLGQGTEFRMKTQTGPPVLEMLVYKDRVVAVFSPLDFSCALESSGSIQCRGYTRSDAARIAINILLFARLQ